MPNEITHAIVADRLADPDCADGPLVDGYPHTPQQVVECADILGGTATALDAVVLLEADPDELPRSLLRRLQEQRRADDTESVIGDGSRCDRELLVRVDELARSMKSPGGSSVITRH